MSDLSRRAFLRLSAHGAAVVGMGGVGGLGEQFHTKWVPYVHQPHDPVELRVFATTCRECPAGCGMHVRHVFGRAIKAEGNPDHPLNLGGLCARGQSALQGLYDPDRVRRPLRRDATGALLPSTWGAALQELGPRLRRARRVALVSGLETGTLYDLMVGFAQAFDGPLLLSEPFDYAALKAAHGALDGRAVVPSYDLAGADFIMSFGADFLETWVSNVEFARTFAAMHGDPATMGRFVYVGPRQSMTAANADAWLAVPPGGELLVAAAMLSRHGGAGLQDTFPELAQETSDEALARVGIDPAAVAELSRRFFAASAPLALAGAPLGNGPREQALAMAAALLTRAAGEAASGRLIDTNRPHALSRVSGRTELAALLDDQGPEDVLVVHGADPAYVLPGSAEVLRQAGTVVVLAGVLDETAAQADWVLPVDNPLEAWGDYSPYPDVHGLIQPAMSRLHDTRLAGDVLLSLAEAGGKPITSSGTPVDDFQSLLRARWSGMTADFAEAQRGGGVWQGSGSSAAFFAELPESTPSQPREASEDLAGEGRELSLVLWSSVLLFDGRTANRGWIQEVPEPVDYLAWGSWLDLHPDTARELGVAAGDLVQVSTARGLLAVPAHPTPHIHPGAAGLAFGQGHTLGRVAGGVGVNAFALLDPAAAGQVVSARLQSLGKSALLVSLSTTSDQHGRELLRWVDHEVYASGGRPEPDAITWPTPRGYSPETDLYPPHEHRDHRWAMVIDLQRCIGCGACSVACYAENNNPIMGAEHVRDGRVMSWLQVLPYRHDDDPRRLAWLPLPCQHCDAAPCEPVCPVFAAVHTDEGLNAQVYNRCVGTRYCSNNCPYKVRRFNWFNTSFEPPLDWQLNPEVTVRCRGVMEKCTFCVQRIHRAEYLAKLEDRPVRDGEVQPACVQSCPTRAFVFGDLKDPESRVSRLFAEDPRRYQVLHELNTKPAVVYLKRVRRDLALGASSGEGTLEGGDG